MYLANSFVYLKKKITFQIDPYTHVFSCFQHFIPSTTGSDSPRSIDNSAGEGEQVQVQTADPICFGFSCDITK